MILIGLGVVAVACGQKVKTQQNIHFFSDAGTPDSHLLKKVQFPWLAADAENQPLAIRIAAPPGYKRVTTEPAAFSAWLRNLPVKTGNPPVRTFDGQKRWNQSAHCAVLDVDVGTKDLQQCADAVIRLRAEYLFSQNAFDRIVFNFTSGDAATYNAWKAGYRPVVNGNNVSWVKSGKADSSYKGFRKYLETVFSYAGSYSLSKEMKQVTNTSDILPGDVFVEGGFPGHAVLVLDVAEHETTGKKIFLLCQSYMPAQDIHILINPSDNSLSPWYSADFGETLHTPQWTFSAADLRRF